jgi:hypothetical protein
MAQVGVALIGAGLLAFAFVADHRWFDRHFLPAFVITRPVYALIASLARVVIAGLAILFLFVWHAPIARFVVRVPPRRLITDSASIFVAITLALGASELILRRAFGHAAEERPADEEPLRQRDARLGWVFVPSHTGQEKIGGRTVEYAFNREGYRVRSAEDATDFDRPTVVFTGESVMTGYALNWDESVPAQVQALAGIKSANIAVNGYATDQAYLRLRDELPRFHHPVALVILFMPTLFDRNLDVDRPHLGPGLVWEPGIYQWRLARVLDIMFPYRSITAVERGISVTSEVLRATVELARNRAAMPIILIPQFTPEDPTELKLRQRILDDAGLPYLRVPLDASWHVRGDSHPDARAAHAMAVAIVDRLRNTAPANESAR